MARRSRLLAFLLGPLVVASHVAVADLVSPYGGETAPNFVEIAVAEDHVTVRFEIDPKDYPFFVGPDDGTGKPLSQRTGETFRVEADGKTLEPEIRTVDLRARKPRVTAAAAIVTPRARSSQLIYAELDYPFVGRPGTFAFTPPLDTGGMPAVSLGVLVDHIGVPVTDYRYLSRTEVMLPRWDDPWFSVFENPNLTRHHKSPLMSFLSMEPREVRHEIIVRLRDLEDWVDLGLGAAASLGAEQMAEVAPRAAAFMRERNPLVIDGERVLPEDVRVSRIAVGAEGLRILEDAERTDRSTALLGLVLSYPRPALAQEVDMTWDLFPEGGAVIPVTLTDPAGGVPAQVRADSPTVRWINHLITWEEPHARLVTVISASVIELPLLAIVLCLGGVGAAWVAVRMGGAWRIVGLPVGAAVRVIHEACPSASCLMPWWRA